METYKKLNFWINSVLIIYAVPSKELLDAIVQFGEDVTTGVDAFLRNPS